MAEGRESAEWAQTFAIIGRISNLFATAGEAIDIRRFIPEHLKAPSRPVPEPSPEEIKANWAAMRVAFTRAQGG